MKTTQRIDTNDSTNHGPEIGNPNPEKFTSDDPYPVIIPNAQIKNYVAKRLIAKFPQEKRFNFSEFGEIQDSEMDRSKLKGFALKLHGEEQIIFLFNLLRRIGYPLRVNPRWNWVLKEEEKVEFLVNPFDDEKSEYMLPSGNKPKFRALEKREAKIDWVTITDRINAERENYDKSREALGFEAIKQFTKNLPKNANAEISKFHDNLIELLDLLEEKVMNHVVKFRDRMRDASIEKLDEGADVREILSEIIIRYDDTDKKTKIQKLVANILEIVPKALDVNSLVNTFQIFYSLKLNIEIQNQMLLISELESAPSITYSWGSVLSSSVSELFKSDVEYIKLVKNIGHDDMSKEDKRKIHRILELAIQTGDAFEKWREDRIKELKIGLGGGVGAFKTLIGSDTTLAVYARLILPNVLGAFTGKLSEERGSVIDSTKEPGRAK